MTRHFSRRSLLSLSAGMVLTTVIRPAISAGASKVGVLMGSGDDEVGRAQLASFNRGLAEAGWSQGKLSIDVHWTFGDPTTLHRVRFKLDDAKVLMMGGNRTFLAAAPLTGRIPIVFIGSDPVASGIVKNPARPEGRVTGLAVFDYEVIGKILEFLLDIRPEIKIVNLLFPSSNERSQRFIDALTSAATSKGVRPRSSKYGDYTSLLNTLVEIGAKPNSAVIFTPDNFALIYRTQIASKAAELGIVTGFSMGGFVDAGGLLSYAPNISMIYFKAGQYVGRILSGEHIANLPLQLPDHYDLSINLSTANKLGCRIPEHLLAVADRFVE